MFVVLGATGKVGRSTISELRRSGAPVTAVVRNGEAARDLQAIGCKIAVADIRDSGALCNAMRDATAVQVICPTSTRAEDASSEMQAAISAIAAALDAARPRSILAISDYGAHLTADTGITLTFRRLEDELRKLDAPLTFVRSAEHMQNWSRLAKHAVRSGLLPSMHHPITKRFPTISASDVGLISADLLMSAGDAPLRIVHAEGPERYSVEEVARILGELAGRQVTAKELPPTEWVPTLIGGGLSSSYANLVAATYRAHNAGLIDVERDVGETATGKTTLREVLAPMVGNG